MLSLGAVIYAAGFAWMVFASTPGTMYLSAGILIGFGLAGSSFTVVLGAFGKLLGLDAFNLLVGQSPGNITGGSEGLVLGAAVGLAACLASRSSSLRWGAAVAALCGGASGLAVSASGGRLMLGSLDLLERGFPGSRIRLDVISRIFGETSFGPVTLAVTAALEGALFTAGVVAAMQFARRRDSEA